MKLPTSKTRFSDNHFSDDLTLTLNVISTKWITLEKHWYDVFVLSGLRRILKKMNLFRRKNMSDLLDTATFIVQELHHQNGYRFMHRKCLNAGYKIKRDDVAALLQILDADGVAIRRRRRLKRRRYNCPGPNSMWHVDSYDKLKRFGVCINGCADGFSRKWVWLKATGEITSAVVAGHFITAVKDIGGCPDRMRGDMGSENLLTSYLLEFLTGNSLIFGRSVHNTRIESLWAMLRKECAQIWIDSLQQLSST